MHVGRSMYFLPTILIFIVLLFYFFILQLWVPFPFSALLVWKYFPFSFSKSKTPCLVLYFGCSPNIIGNTKFRMIFSQKNVTVMMISYILLINAPCLRYQVSQHCLLDIKQLLVLINNRYSMTSFMIYYMTSNGGTSLGYTKEIKDRRIENQSI